MSHPSVKTTNLHRIGLKADDARPFKPSSRHHQCIERFLIDRFTTLIAYWGSGADNRGMPISLLLGIAFHGFFVLAVMGLLARSALNY